MTDTTHHPHPNAPVGVRPAIAANDIEADFAVRPIHDTSVFWPSPCEPCPGGPIHIPEGDCGQALDVPPAHGGCVRPRFFDGMFLTREDLETQLRYLRMKLRLQNRAAGSGVVWGLGVSLQGEQIVVAPGYGVDACGNDLTVACDYSVPARLLLTDPEVCRDRGERRCYSLLLEYVECLEEPRPVHGDGCGPAVPGCEMSRVRETVRLRLVPPRPAPASPLVELLTKLEGLTGAGLTKVPVRLVDEGSPEVEAPASVGVPFTVVTTLGTQTELEPSRTNTVQATIPSISPDGMFSLRVRPHQGVAVLSGTVTTDDATTVATLGPNGAQWNTMIGKIGSFTFTVDWSARTDAELRGTTTIHAVSRGGEVVVGVVADPTSTQVYVRFPDGHDLAPGDVVQVERPEGGNTWAMPVAEIVDDMTVVLSRGPNQAVRQGSPVRYSRGYELETIIAPTRILMRQAVLARPCCGDGCCSDHDTPPLEDRLQALLVALLYGRLVQQQAALSLIDRTESLQAVTARMRTLLDVRPSQAAEVERLVAALYRAWCAAAIYPGPERHDPDGVVIGCVSIRNGAICEVDQLDGRRWVVHQPLLDHWSIQFGLDPLDSQVTALFRRLCCLANLPGFGSLLSQQVVLEQAPGMRAMTTTNLTQVEASTAAAATSNTLARLAQVGNLDLQTIALLVDEMLCARQRGPVIQTLPDRAIAVVASAHAELAPRDQPNMALREAAREVTHAVLETIPASAAVAADNPMRLVLDEAGVGSMEVAIAVDRAALGEVGTRIVTDEQLRTAMDATEGTAVMVSRLVARSIRDATGLSEPDQLRDPKIADAVADQIVSKLADEHIEVDREAILRAVIRERR